MWIFFMMKRFSLAIKFLILSVGFLLVYLNWNFIEYSLRDDYFLCSPRNTIESNTLINADELLNISNPSSHPNAPKNLLTSLKLSSLLPDFVSILWTGVTWQETTTNSPKFLLYSAHTSYYTTKNDLKIYAISLFSGQSTPELHTAYIWFNMTGPPVYCPYLQLDILDWQGFAKDRLVPYLMTCSVPQKISKDKSPLAASILKSPCLKATNVLQIPGSSPTPVPDFSPVQGAKHTLQIGVCAPALYYYHQDFSIRMLEWVEVLKKLGISKFFIYKSKIHKNLEKVLQFYEDKGEMVTVEFNYPPPYVDYMSFKRLWTQIKRKELFSLENVYYTDCILRFKHDADYLAHFDPDEIPLLQKHETIQDFILYIESKYAPVKPASIQLKWWPFYNDLETQENLDIPKSFHILRHVKHPSSLINQVDNNVKSLYNTKQVIAAFSHKPLYYSDDSKKLNVEVNMSDAYLAHYRKEGCKEKCPPGSTSEDTRLLKYYKDIVDEVKKIADQLDIPLD